MFARIVRRFVVASGLVAVAGVAAAGMLGLGEGPRGTAEVELLDNVPVLTGDLGEIVVHASREDLPEVVVAAKRALPADGVLADVTVTAKRALPAEGVIAEVVVAVKRERPRAVEFAMVAGVPAGALVQ